MAEARQMFAALALNGLLSSRDYGLLAAREGDGSEQVKQQLAARSWELADALLAAEHSPATVVEEPSTSE